MHKVFTRFLAVATLLTCMASVASSANFPNATFPDSVTIKQIQDITAVGHVALGDTVGENRVGNPLRTAPYDSPFGGGIAARLPPDAALVVVVAWLVGALVVSGLVTERADIGG